MKIMPNPFILHFASFQQDFSLGAIVATQGAIRLAKSLGNADEVFMQYLTRHARSDWGDVCKEDRETNNIAIKAGDRLISSYETSQGKLWIITEADRSVTTFLLPEEY